jgi:integrase
VASVYARGRKLCCRLKGDEEPGTWSSAPTPFQLCHGGDAAEACTICKAARRSAERYAREAQKAIDERNTDGGEPSGQQTVRRNSLKWLAERRARGIRSVDQEESRLRHYLWPRLGSMSLAAVRPRDIRDLIRELRAKGELAPRSILNVYGVIHALFRDAVVEELIATNPCILKRGELPTKVDKDPEWRALATYTIREVEQLISDPRIPVERRVQNALKAIAGLRHGEVAGLRWRHYDPTMEPLGRLIVATSYDTGRTKTEVTRRVPVHPTLATLLAAWKLSHWARLYGRQPTPDDLIVPTRAMSPVSPTIAARAFKEDLTALGMRLRAGRERDRGGHDLRAWFITTAQEHGAHRDLLRVVTHTAKSDVVSGYTRATWAALCAEVAKLRVAVLDGEVLPLATGFATREKSAGRRWTKVGRLMGIEPTTPRATTWCSTN